MRRREEVPPLQKWNTEALYPDSEEWEKEYDRVAGTGFSGITSWKGRLAQGADKVRALLEEMFAIGEVLDRLLTYAHLRADEDVGNDENKALYERARLLTNAYRTETAWIEPELLALSPKEFSTYSEEKELQPFRFYLERIRARKPHTLSTESEQLLSLGARSLATPSKAFSMLNNVDLTFPHAETEKGEPKELTYGLYSLYMHSPDRVLRKSAFLRFHERYGAMENTATELLSGAVHGHLFRAKARHYPTALDAALEPDRIDPAIYRNLIATVREGLPSLHGYVKLRKKMLGVPTLHAYDLQAPLMADTERVFSYEEAKEAVLASVAVMGPEYTEILRRGLNEERWVDPFENKRKRSGAYSSGCYGTLPYILMNFHGTERDVSTLSHEAGHSMHTYLSNRTQPYQYAEYTIFLAEIASTFHEELLFRYLLTNARSEEEKRYFIERKINGIVATLFRQTQFAEFELRLYTLAEEDVPITPGRLKEIYRELSREYYGSDLTLDPETEVEFLRIPHFYANFYVYQYATGISAAYTFAQRVCEGDARDRDDYMRLLSSGSSDYPLNLLVKSGVDLRDRRIVRSLIDRFDELVSLLS
ncbi:MAG: oligoendopeptidase F [Simkaniaceae bacterium]|nr:oligoendopeptidase F [Simkaniaceae bacterium]